MGTYMGSPWGIIRGKIHDTVGGVWKGIEWVRVRVLPTQRGTLQNYRLLKDGLIPPERFSYPQMNIRRVVLQVLGYIGRGNLPNFIYPVWEALVTKRGWTMTGINAFVRRNASNFFNSLTDRNLEYDADTNKPDPCTILMSEGDLEPSPSITASTYTISTGDITVDWDPTIVMNGSADDFAFLVVLKMSSIASGLLEEIGRYGNWYPGVYLYGTGVPVPPPGMQEVRSAGTISRNIGKGHDMPLYAYVFFRDEQGAIGYSKSTCLISTHVP